MAATTLSAGDIAIVAYATDPIGADGDDVIRFVLLEPIGSGTQIFFTDRSWNGTAFAAAGGGDSTFTYTAGVDLPAGTVITITSAQLLSAGIDLSNGGDTIYAYQGTDANTPTRFIYAADIADGNTTFNGSLANTGLTAGTNAVAVAFDQASYAGQSTQIQQTQLAAISNNVSWHGTNGDDIGGTIYDDRSDVTLSGPLNNPDMQLFVVNNGGGQSDAIVRIDNDEASNVATNLTRLFRDNPNFTRLEDITFDIEDGVWFAADNEGTDITRILKGNISDLVSGTSTPTITVLFDYPNDSADSNDDKFIQGIEIDTAANRIFFTLGDIIAGHEFRSIDYNGGNARNWGLIDEVIDPTFGFAGGIEDFVVDPLHNTAYFSYVLVDAGAGQVLHNYVVKLNATAGLSGNPNPVNDHYDIVNIANAGAPPAGYDPGRIPDAEGSIRGMDYDAATNTLWFITGRLGAGGTGGVFKLDLTTNIYTEVWQQPSNNAHNTPQSFPTTLLVDIEVDSIGGRYYITSLNSTDTPIGHDGTATDENGSRIWSGSLTSPIGTAPTFFASVFENTANGAGAGMEIDYAPTLTLSGAGSTYTETAGSPSAAGPTVDVATSPSVNDADQAIIQGATVAITTGFISGDTLTFTNSGGITGSYNSTTGLITFTGNASFAAYQTVLDSVRFTNAGDNPTSFGANNSRTISFTVFDGLINSDPATATVTVIGINDAPVNVIPASDTGNEDTTFVIENIQVGDVDADPASQDIVVTLAVTRGTLSVNTGVLNGLAAGEVSGNGTATVILTGTQNQINTTLANATGLQFTGGTNVNGTVTLTVTTNDQGFNGTDPLLTGTATSEQDSDQFTVTVTAVNDAPVRGGDGTEDAVLISEDQPSAGGQTVNALAGALFSDAADDQDAFPGGSSPNAFAGIAVHVNNSNANGQWQYSTDGTIWNDIGAASLAAAKLISAADFVRFNPAVNFNGAAPSLAFLLVDDSGGALVSGTTANASVIGGTSRYSDEGVFLNQQVTAVNDAPNVVGGAAVTLTAINEDNTNPPGATVTTLFTGNFSDADDNVGVPSVDTFSGIAITGNAATTEGVWQYFTAGSWTTLPAVATNNAFLVAAADSLRFLPALNFNGAAPLLTVHLVEDVNGGSAVITGTTADLTTTGDPTRFSAALTLGQAVNPVNDVPIFNAATLSVAEFGTNGSANGTVVGTVTASDPDTTLTYSLTDTAGGRFAIDGASGQITVADGTLLDFEQANSHSITVQASGDPGGAIFQAFSVTITDVTPENVTGDGNANTFHGGPDNDRLNGLGGIDNLVGNGGNDALNGGAAADIMAGGQGRDVYFADDTNDQANENPSEGTDTVFASTDYTLGANVEDLVLTGSNPINGTGNGGNNSIYSNTGAGTLTGGDGRDTYVVHNSLITVIELSGLNSGYDTIIADVDFTIAPNVEDLVLIGSNLTGTGSAGANSMYSMGGPNTLIGLGASDSYVIHNSGDQIVEIAGVLEGHDTIFTDADFDMATNAANVEDVVLLGTGNLSVSGNSSNNSIYGNTGINILSGGDGRDSYVVHNSDTQVIELNGPNSGKDTVLADVSFVLSDNVEDLVLFGPNPIDGTGNGINNSIYGSSGNNILTGLGGSDSFVIRGPAFGHDRITDFDVDFDYVFFSSSLFANSTAMFNATADDGNGNAVITFNANNTLTLEDVTKAEMQAHSGDFLFI